VKRGGGASGGEHVRYGGRGTRTDSKIRRGGLQPIDGRRLDELLKNGSAPEPEPEPEEDAMLMEKLTDWTKRLGLARGAVEAVGATAKGLRDEHARLEQERITLISAKPPREDIAATVNAEVDRLGRAWLDVAGAAVLGELAGGVEVDGHGQFVRITPGVLGRDFGPLAGYVTLASLCAIVPDLVKTGLAQVLDAVPYTAGPPMAERAGRIAAVDERIADVEREHAILVDQAAAVGVSMEHMPGERARRTGVAQRRELAEANNRLNASAIAQGRVKPEPVE